MIDTSRCQCGPDDTSKSIAGQVADNNIIDLSTEESKQEIADDITDEFDKLILSEIHNGNGNRNDLGKRGLLMNFPAEVALYGRCKLDH